MSLGADLSPLWLAALPAVLALVIWAVVDLQRFLLFAVLGTMFVPRALAQPGGTEIALADILLVVALGAWLVAGSAQAAEPPWLRGNRLLMPALLFVAINVESLAWSVNPDETILFCIQLIEIVIVLPVAFASLPTSLDSIRRGLIVFVVPVCVIAAITFVSYVPQALAGNFEGKSLPLGLNKNFIGSFAAAGVIVAYALWLAEARRRAKLVLGMAVIVQMAGLFASVSRGSLIGAIIGLFAVSFLLRRGRVLTVAVTLITATVFVATIGLKSGVDRTLRGSYDSSIVRTYSFANAIEKIEHKPLLGTGAGTYQDYIRELEFFLPDPNNMFLLTWAETGVLGLAALLLLLFCFARGLAVGRNLPVEAAVPAVAGGCVMLSFIVHSQLDATWTRGTSSIAFAMLGLMLACERLSMAPASARLLTRSAPRALGQTPSPQRAA